SNPRHSTSGADPSGRQRISAPLSPRSTDPSARSSLYPSGLPIVMYSHPSRPNVSPCRLPLSFAPNPVRMTVRLPARPPPVSSNVTRSGGSATYSFPSRQASPIGNTSLSANTRDVSKRPSPSRSSSTRMRHLRVPALISAYRSSPDDSATNSRPRSSKQANIGNTVS